MTVQTPQPPVDTHDAFDGILPPLDGGQVPVVPVPKVEIHEPLSVIWQGVEYAVSHWDVSGFTLQAPIPRVVAPGVGRVFDRGDDPFGFLGGERRGLGASGGEPDGDGADGWGVELGPVGDIVLTLVGDKPLSLL